MVRLEQILLNSQPNICDSCNSNICYFGEQLYVVTESSSNIQRIDPDTLKVMENVSLFMFKIFRSLRVFFSVNGRNMDG